MYTQAKKTTQIGNIRIAQEGPPEWHSGLRHCIAVLAVTLEILGSTGDPWGGAQLAQRRPG